MPLDVRHTAKGMHVRSYTCKGGKLTRQEQARLGAELRELIASSVKRLSVEADGVIVEKQQSASWTIIGPIVYARLWAALVASANPPKMRGWPGV